MPVPALPAGHIRRLRALRTRGMREKYRQCIVEGRRLVDEALASDWSIDFLCVVDSESAAAVASISSGAPVYAIDTATLEEISTTEHSQGILAVVETREFAFEESRTGIVVALDRIADPGNVGTIIRTADWFGAASVVMGTGCAELYNPKTLRATMGSVFHVPIVTDADLGATLSSMKRSGYSVWCAAVGGETITATHRGRDRAVLVIGSEAHGIDPAVLADADSLVGIPRFGRAESLNAATATAALLALLRADHSG